MSGNPFGSSGGGSSSGSSSTSSSSSSSSSSAPAGPTAAQLQAMDNARASFREMLRRWGLPPSKNLLNLIEKAVMTGWNSSLFLDRLRHTPEYVQRYPGIQWKDGMTEGTYISTFNAYKNLAEQSGVQFTRTDFAKALKRGVSPQEFSDRVQAIKSIDRWGPMWQTFSDALAARGLTKGLSKKDLADFVMHLGPKQWEKVYDETFLTAGLERIAGIQVGKQGIPGQDTPYSLTRGDMLDIVNQLESISKGSFDPSQLDFAKIGTELRRFKPEYLANYGVTTRDIVELEAGGPRAASIAVKAQRILDTQQAATQPQAVPTTALGRTNQPELPQSR